MAKKSQDLILRDRLEFTLDAAGDLAVVYGRVDLSDFVSTTKNQGLSIKEVRFQLRDPSVPNTGSMQGAVCNDAVLTAGGQDFGVIKMFASTTAYERGSDVGIASPNVLCVVEKKTTFMVQGAGPAENAFWNEYFQYGTPDLHPDGYTVVTDLLIGVCAESANLYASKRLELDIMLIAEEVKVTKDELNEMLIQAQDL